MIPALKRETQPTDISQNLVTLGGPILIFDDVFTVPQVLGSGESCCPPTLWEALFQVIFTVMEPLEITGPYGRGENECMCSFRVCMACSTLH